MEVYLLTRSEPYGDTTIYAIFSSRAAAEAAAIGYAENEGRDVGEFDITMRFVRDK
jgi:hypothetical protein